MNLREPLARTFGQPRRGPQASLVERHARRLAEPLQPQGVAWVDPELGEPRVASGGVRSDEIDPEEFISGEEIASPGGVRAPGHAARRHQGDAEVRRSRRNGPVL